MVFLLDLSVDEKFISLKMPNGDVHICHEDSCDCIAAMYGNLCRHRLFIFAMGGFDALKKTILSERRKAQRNQPNSTASDTKGHEPQ